MTNPAGSFIWYELVTPDPAASKAFYDAVVGWSMATDPVAPGLEYRMIVRSGGESAGSGMAGGVLTLTDEMRDHGGRPGWLGYVYVPDVDAAVAAIRADGGAIVREAWDQPGVGRLALIAGPEGAPLYVMDPLPPEGQPDADSKVFSVTEPQHVRWNELSSDDPDRSLDFVKRHFGWDQQGVMEMGDLGQYRFVQAGAVTIGAVMPKMPQSPAGGWTYYIGVDDIDRAATAIGDGGGTILHGPVEIPGGDYSLTARDPEGAAFGLVGPRVRSIA